MHKTLLLLALAVSATPAAAQDSARQLELPRELSDPDSALRLAAKLQAISSALMNIRVGAVSAAVEGREASPGERNTTIGDLVRRKDPDFDRHVQEKVASIGPKVMHSVATVQRTLPQVMHDVEDAQRSLEHALANLPDPTYPRR